MFVLRALFNGPAIQRSKNRRILQRLKAMTRQELSLCSDAVIYSSLCVLSEHILREAQLRKAWRCLPQSRAITVNERYFFSDIALGRRLSQSRSISNILEATMMTSSMSGSIWIMENREEICSVFNHAALNDMCNTFLHSQFNELSQTSGLALIAPRVVFKHALHETALGWTNIGCVRTNNAYPADIVINTATMDCMDPVSTCQTVLHESVHSFLSQIAHHVVTGTLTPDHDLYDDGVHFLAKRDIGYAATPLIRSYYNDAEEKLAHWAHQSFMNITNRLLTASCHTKEARP